MYPNRQKTSLKKTKWYFPPHARIRNYFPWRAWVAWLVKHITLDLDSSNDLKSCEFQPRIRLLSVWSMLKVLSLPLPCPPSPSLPLFLSLPPSLSKNKRKKITFPLQLSSSPKVVEMSMKRMKLSNS